MLDLTEKKKKAIFHNTFIFFNKLLTFNFLVSDVRKLFSLRRLVKLWG